jgi:hypothetical protein
VNSSEKDSILELPETLRDDILAYRLYLIVCYRDGQPCTYQMYRGDAIAASDSYFSDTEDSNGKPLTYRFFVLPKTVR